MSDSAIRSNSEFAFLTLGNSAQTAQMGGLGIGSSYSGYPAFTGGVNTQNGYQVAGMTVIDSSRNLTNVNQVSANSLNIDGGSNFGEYHGVSTTLTVTPTWQDVSDIAGSTLATGTWAVSVYFYSSGAYLETYTGIMQWYAGGTNDNTATEMVLHHAGHADNGPNIYLRVLRRYSSSMILQIASSSNISSTTYTMKFRRLI